MTLGNLAHPVPWCLSHLPRELWIPENLAQYKTDKMTEKQGGVLSGRQKQYLRYMRNRKPNLGAGMD